MWGDTSAAPQMRPARHPTIPTCEWPVSHPLLPLAICGACSRCIPSPPPHDFSAPKHPCVPEQADDCARRPDCIYILCYDFNYFFSHFFFRLPIAGCLSFPFPSSSPCLFEKVIAGVPSPSIAWYKNGRQLFSNRFVHIQEGRLAIRSADESDAGTYACKAENLAGSEIKPLTLGIGSSFSICPFPHSPACQFLSFPKVLPQSCQVQALSMSKSSGPPRCSVAPEAYQSRRCFG